MHRNPLEEKDFRRFKEMLENEPKLKEIVDAVVSEEATHARRRQLRIPYVSAPPLTERAWK